MTPSDFFFKELKRMENLFLCYHGESSLNPSKNSTKILAAYMSKYVLYQKRLLPTLQGVACFFRMRVLNRAIISSRCKKKIIFKIDQVATTLLKVKN